ncbi:PREDICTED: formin-binding protein 1-like isoform X2 [Amphimedon queenslandica]|uniref:SH3 domain-containing protein n=1 Tax=Amphimedon queenslandica TaxID=400682 RepID=A0A1X7VAL4_AMPQE|nr:PREDICTED: formin-binding protein 1-like isoform X2 [Amphimedon queenslandica]|eukprot:XP_019849936.1 PREDICTED: formin-binding protein 1-like isoform X2 [Amphimedon queenslandica]
MSWGSELWDQYEAICTHTDHEIEFIRRVSSFVKDRIHAETVYAKELRKLVKSYRKREEEDSKYTNIQAFGKLVVETNDLAGQRELIAEYLQNEVFKPLNELAKNTTAVRRKMMLEGQELHKKLKESMDQLENAKRIYRKASEEKEVAAHALDRADNDPQSTKAKIDKLTQISRGKDQAGEESRNNYILQLEATNQYRRQHYTQLMPQHMDTFMQMNTDHINTYKALINAYAESHRRVNPVINTCLDNITAGSDAIDPDKDNRQFIEERKTGYPVPGNVDFEEYQGKIKKKEKDKKDDKKKLEARDFSHLPPEQRKKRLIKKIGELEAAMEKTTSDMTAMEKMKTIYEQNPSLGDAQQVAQRLAENAEKIGIIKSEIQEFKGYLSEAGSGGSAKNGKSPAAKKKEKVKEKKEERPRATSKLSSTDIEVVSNNSSTAAHPSPQGSTDNVKAQEEWFSDDEDGGSKDQSGDAGVWIMVYDFEAQNEDELSCRANDIVTIIEDLGDGWLRVRKGKDEGYVPQSYVQKNS